MGLFDKAKKAFAESRAEKAELKQTYKEEYEKEKSIQDSGRRLVAREEARDRARAKARAPPISERVAVGAGRVAESTGRIAKAGAIRTGRGIGNIIKASAKSDAKSGRGTDFLGVGGNMFGMQQPARPRAKARPTSSRASQRPIIINVGAQTGARTTKRKKKKRKSKPSATGFGDWF